MDFSPLTNFDKALDFMSGCTGIENNCFYAYNLLLLLHKVFNHSLQKIEEILLRLKHTACVTI